MLLLSNTSRAPSPLASSAPMARLSRYSRSLVMSTRRSKSTFIRPGAGVAGRAGTGGMGATIGRSSRGAGRAMYSMIKRVYSVAVKVTRSGKLEELPAPGWAGGSGGSSPRVGTVRVHGGFVRPGRGTRSPAAAGTGAAGPVRAGARAPHPVLAQPHLPDRAGAVRSVGGRAVRPGHRTANLTGLPVQRRGARGGPDGDRARRRPRAGRGQRGGHAPRWARHRPAGRHQAHHRP